MVPKKLNPTRQKALKAIRSGNYEEALEHCEKLIQLHPKSCTYRCDRAEVFIGLGKKSRAIEDLDRVLNLKPDKSNALYLRGLTLYKEHDYNDKKGAIYDLCKALKIDPNDPLLALESHKICIEYFKQREDGQLELINHMNAGLLLKPQDVWLLSNRASIYYQSQLFPRAIDDLNVVLSIEPNNIEALQFRANVHKKISDYEKSFDDISKAIQLSPETPSLLLKRAKLFKLKKEFEKSLNDLEQLSNLLSNPKSTIAASLFSNRGQVYQGLFRYKEASNDYTRALNLKPKSSTYRRRAEIYQILRQYQDALEDAKSAMKIDKDDIKAATLINQLYTQLNRHDEALNLLDNSLSKSPNDVIKLSERGTVYKALKRYDEALNDLNKALSIDAKNIPTYLSRAKIYREQKDYAKSLSDITSAIKLDLKNSKLIRNRGKIYTLSEKYDEAMLDLDKSISTEPNNPSGYRYRGKAFSKINKYEEAMKDFDKVMKLKPNDPNALHDRSETLYKMNKFNEALSDINKSLELDENTNSYELRASIYEKLGDHKNVILDLSKVFEVNPKDKGVLFRRAKIYESQGQYYDALNDWSQLVKLESKNLEYLKDRARLLLTLCRYEILKLQPGNQIIICKRLEIYQYFNKTDEAIEELTKLIDSTIDKELFCVTRGVLYYSKGNQETALEDFDKVLGLGKAKPKEQITYTKDQLKALCYRGCINHSLIDLNVVLENEPDNILALCERSSIYRDRNDHDGAWKDLKTVLNNELNSSNSTYQHRYCHNSTQLTTISKVYLVISLLSTLQTQLLQSSLIMLPLVGIFGQNQQQSQKSDSVTTQAVPIQQQQLTHNNKHIQPRAQQKQSTNFNSTYNPIRRKKPSNRMNRKKIDQAIAFSAFAVEEDHQGNHEFHADQSRKDALKTKLRDFIDRAGLSEEMISESSDSKNPNLYQNNYHKSCCVDSDSFNKYHSSNCNNNNINNDDHHSNDINNAGISDHIIQAAITGAVALKQSPIPDAITATVNYTMKKIKNIDETYGLQDKAWEISRSGINLAFEIDQQYNVHEKVGNVLFTESVIQKLFT
ncbi:4080_t:CDS:2 [Entrophospora sp. SA101]|nr:12060_t:CDS:2 [Entrophospora sp. SA101]CAJ0848936.1 4080_t:CDS:2 [Entrophospora sp. SA101]